LEKRDGKREGISVDGLITEVMVLRKVKIES
jgi:hypothetical protein